MRKISEIKEKEKKKEKISRKSRQKRTDKKVASKGLLKQGKYNTKKKSGSPTPHAPPYDARSEKIKHGVKIT